MPSFLSLPAELRNRIYEYALVERDSISITECDTDFKYWPLSKAITQPALTRTCAQIRHESLPIFYGANVFHLLHKHGHLAAMIRMLGWLDKIGIENRASLRRVLMCTGVGPTWFRENFRNAQNEMSERKGRFRRGSHMNVRWGGVVSEGEVRCLSCPASRTQYILLLES